MLENLLTNVECDDFNLSRFGESQSNKRIVNRERLQRLERIKIVTESFVGEIQTRPDYRHASYRSLCKRCSVLHVAQDRKSTRLNSSHSQISYAVFCLN